MKNRYTYDPFGELFDTETEQTISNPFKFTGQYFNSEIDEYYLHARQYDPHIARFTARDPIFGKFKEPLTLHKYLYCLNDPINKTDPSGEMTNTNTELVITQAIGGAMMGALGGGIEGIIKELWDWKHGGKFSWGDVGSKIGKGAIWGAIVGGARAYFLGKAVLTTAFQKEDLFTFGAGVVQGLLDDIWESRKGGGGLNKVNAGIAMHNAAIDAMVESLW